MLTKLFKNWADDSENTGSFMIVGLGNPGREYKQTRHNIGFMVVEQFASRHAIKLTRIQNKSIIGTGSVENRKIILVKPQTYMNLSGNSVASLVRFYKIQLKNLVVVHDDVDLPFGTLRMRPGGGSAGQKGMNSLIDRLGTQEFPRLRMGVGRPPGQKDAADYVLKPFLSSEQEILIDFISRAVDALDCYLVEGIEQAMNHYNPIQ